MADMRTLPPRREAAKHSGELTAEARAVPEQQENVRRKDLTSYEARG